MIKVIFFVLSLFFYSCTPIKSSPEDEKHKEELSLHEVQTNIDDMRHDLNSFQTEFQIIDSKIDSHEKLLKKVKNELVRKNLAEIDVLAARIKNIERDFMGLEKMQKSIIADIKKISTHSSKTNSFLGQYKKKIKELEKVVVSQNKRFEEIKELKKTLKAIASAIKSGKKGFFSYKVKAKDTLGDIARSHGVTVSELKRVNNLKEDTIFIGQELKIPK
jgi:LysM repeat protein